MKKITPVATKGVMNLNLDLITMMRINEYAINRWIKEKDGFNVFTPIDNFVEISDGNKLIEKESYEKIDINQKLYCIVDDHGQDSEYGLVVTILLPEEY